MKKLATAWRVFRLLGPGEFIMLLSEKFSKLLKNKYPEESKFPIYFQNCVTPEAVISILTNTDSVSLQSLEAEYSVFSRDFASKLSQSRKLYFGEIFDIGPNLRKFIYIFVRLEHSIKVLETGVASGASTNTILSALKANGQGSLTSVDVTPNVGELVDRDLFRFWDLKIIGRIFNKYKFRRLVENLGVVNLFIHDSNHSPKWQIFEFATVASHCAETGIFVFDDVTPELIDFVQAKFPDFNIFIINEGRKYSAIFTTDLIRD